MSRVVSLMDIPVVAKEVCCLCDKEILCEHSISGHREVIFCGPCYNNIPKHIPVEQDSEYVLAKIKEKL